MGRVVSRMPLFTLTVASAILTKDNCSRTEDLSLQAVSSLPHGTVDSGKSPVTVGHLLSTEALRTILEVAVHLS